MDGRRGGEGWPVVGTHLVSRSALTTASSPEALSAVVSVALR